MGISNIASIGSKLLGAANEPKQQTEQGQMAIKPDDILRFKLNQYKMVPLPNHPVIENPKLMNLLPPVQQLK